MGSPDHRTLFLPGLFALGCFLLYGPAEAMLLSARLRPWALPLYAGFSAALFLLWGIGFLTLRRSVASGRYLLALLAGAAAVTAYVQAFLLALGNVEGRGDPTLLSLANPAPDLLTVGPALEIKIYHAVIFGLFFPLLYFSLALLGGPGVGTGLRLLVAWLGWGALGLTYQDWFYFVAHPTQSLVPGGRYGVYFDHWIGPVPTLYLAAHLWGLALLGLAAWRSQSDVRRAAWGLSLAAGSGVVLTLAKPLWAGL